MKKRSGKPISIAIFTHEKVGQMLDHRPLWIHRHVILIGQKPAHVRHAHSFVYEQAFATPVQGERFDEQLLNAGFAHLLQRQPDLLCLHSARGVFPCDESTEALKRRTSQFSFKNEKKKMWKTHPWVGEIAAGDLCAWRSEVVCARNRCCSRNSHWTTSTPCPRTRCRCRDCRCA